MLHDKDARPLLVLTIDLQGEHFALDARLVREILDLGPTTEVPTAQPFLRRLINVRGKVVPLADLRLRLGMEARPPTIDTRVVVIEIMLDGQPTTVAVLTDKVQEVTEIAVSAMMPAPRIGLRCRPEYVRCIGQRGDDFVIVLDPAKIFAGIGQRQAGADGQRAALADTAL